MTNKHITKTEKVVLLSVWVLAGIVVLNEERELKRSNVLTMIGKKTSEFKKGIVLGIHPFRIWTIVESGSKIDHYE